MFSRLHFVTSLLLLFNRSKLQSCKLYDNKCMTTSTEIRNPKIFAFVAVLVFTLLSRKDLLRKRQQELLKSTYNLRK